MIVELAKVGVKDLHQLTLDAKKHLEKAGFEPHYIEVCRRSDLALAEPGDKELVVLGAAKLGDTRLIDNIEVDGR